MKKKVKSPFWEKMKVLMANRLSLIGLILVIIIVLACIAAPVLTKYDPTTIDYGAILQKPSAEHIMGTDKLGRDVFARVLYGGRTSIYIGVVASLLGSGLGLVSGAFAGYFGGWVDTLFTRLSEIIQTFPNMILILVISAIAGQGVNNLIFIFAITGWMTPFRMVRNQFLTLREETYVEVARSFGFSDLRIIFNHILPNALSPLMVTATTNVAGYILSEAGLSFIGVGIPIQIPTWGSILNAAKSIDVVTDYWWLWLFPGIILSLFSLDINFLGDGLRDAFDPKH